MKKWFVGYEAPQHRPLNAPLGERVEIDGDAFVRHGFVCGSTGAGTCCCCRATGACTGARTGARTGACKGASTRTRTRTSTGTNHIEAVHREPIRRRR